MDEIVINTRIDTSGIDKGIEEIKKKLSGMSDSTVNIGTAMEESMSNANANIGDLLNNLADRVEMFIADFVEGFSDGLNQAYEEAQEKTDTVATSTNTFSEALERNIASIANTTAEIELLLNALLKMSGTMDTNIRCIANGQADMEMFANRTGEASETTSRFGTAFKKAFGVVVSAGKKVVGTIGNIVKRVHDLGARMMGPIKQVGAFVKKFLSIAGLVGILKKVGASFQAAISSLEGWGTKTSMILSDYKKAGKDLNNAIGAALAPLIDTFLPQVTAMMNRLADTFNTIGMYIAALLGKKTYTRAIRYQNDYKDAIAKTGAAADKASGSLAKFDELTIIDTPEEQEQNPFADTAIPEELQQIQSLKDLINSIDFGGAGDKAAEFVNNLMSNIKEKIENFPIEDIVAGLTIFVGRFLTGVNFNNIGATFGSLVNKIVDGIAAIFDTDPDILNKMVQAFLDFITGIFTEIDFEKAGDTFSTVVNKIIEALGKGIREFPIELIVSSIVTFFSKCFDGINFEGFGADLGALVNKIVDGIQTIFDTDPEILNKMVRSFNSFVRGFLQETDFQNLGGTIVKTVGKIIDALIEGIKTFPADDAAEAFSDFLWGAASEIGEFFEDFSFIEFSDTVTDKIVEFVENIKWHRVLGALGKLAAAIVTSVAELIIAGLETPLRLVKELLVRAMNGMGQYLIDHGGPIAKKIGKGMVEASQGLDTFYDNTIGSWKEKAQNSLDEWQSNFNDKVDLMVAKGDEAWEAAHQQAATYSEVTQEMAMEMERQRQETAKSLDDSNKKTAQSYQSVTQEMAMQMEIQRQELQRTGQTSEDNAHRTVRASDSTAKAVEDSSSRVVNANHGAGASFDTTTSKIESDNKRIKASTSGVTQEMAMQMERQRQESVKTAETTESTTNRIVNAHHGAGASFTETTNTIVAENNAARTSSINVTQEMAMQMERQRQENLKTATTAKTNTRDVKDQFSQMADMMASKFAAMSLKVAKQVASMVRELVLNMQNMSTQTTSTVNNMNNNVTSKFSTMAVAASGKLSTMDATVSSKFNNMKASSNRSLEMINSDLSSKFERMSSTATNKLTNMDSTSANKFRAMSATATQQLASMNNDVTNKFSSMSSTMANKLSNMSGDVANKFRAMASNAFTALQGLVNNSGNYSAMIYNTLNGQDWGSIGSNMINGMAQGLTNGWHWLNGVVTDIASKTINAAKRALGIRSPSRVFRDEIGAMVSEGLALGIEDEASAPLRAMNDIATSLTDTAIGSLQAPYIASGAVLPTQIDSGAVRSEYGQGAYASVSLDEVIGMVRQLRDNQQDLLETLIAVVQNKQFSFTPNASNGRMINQSLNAYRRVTG